MKKSSVILPINEEPYLRSYTHNAYINSILTSEYVGGGAVAKYVVLGKKRNWKEKSVNCQTIMGESIEVKSSFQKENGYSLLFAGCEKEDCLIVKVESRRKVCAWESFCLVLDERLSGEREKEDRFLVRLGLPRDEKLYVKRGDEFVKSDGKHVIEDECYLKLERKELEIICSYSEDGKKWNILYTDTLPVKYKVVPLEVGVLAEVKNQYLNWVSCNYIQLCMGRPTEREIMIDYFTAATKHYKHYTTNQFLDFSHVNFDYDKLTPKKMNKKMEELLRKGIYVIMELDHFYIPRTSSYRNSVYFHEVMIYGMDIKRREYYMMAYGDKSVLFTCRLGFSEFWKALNKSEIKIILARVDVNINNYYLDKEIIKKRLSAYLTGYNNEKDFADGLPVQGSEWFGLEIYSQLISSDDDLHIFCGDVRLSYTMYEHKKLMLDRVQYLLDNVDMSKEHCDRILQLLEENIKVTQIIRNTVLMSSVTENKKTSMKKVREYLNNLMTNEKEAYSLLIESL